MKQVINFRDRSRGPLHQRGATLIVGLIMIVLITLVVVSGFTTSSSNLKSVGNMQVREEATAAANHAIEQLISTSFAGVGAVDYSIDLDKDGTSEYTVAVSAPVCIRNVQVATCPASDCSLPSGCGEVCQGECTPTAGSACGTNLTDWDITATVNDLATGAKVVVREGVRVPMSTVAANTACAS